MDQIDKALAQASAIQIWADMNENEKSLVRFGLFPARLMDPKLNLSNVCVALMDIAKAKGGMVA